MMRKLNEELDHIRRLKEGLIKLVPIIGDEKKGKEELRQKNLNEILWIYMHWAYRAVPPRKRKVIETPTFTWENIPEDRYETIKVIISKIEQGTNVSPYLSRKISSQGYVIKELQNSKSPDWADNGGDKDLALNIYGVHHLHLGTKLKSDEFYNPTEDMIFIEFDRNRAHLVYYGKNHKCFHDGSLSNAIAEYTGWKGHAAKGIRLANPERPESEIKKMERRGFCTARQSSYGPVFFYQSVKGHNYIISKHSDGCFEKILDYDNQVISSDENEFLAKRCGLNILKNIGEPEWGVNYCDLTLGNFENGKGIIVLPGPH